MRAQEYVHYRVKKKDTLSQILFSLNISPIYGKHGYLNQVIALNSDKIKKGGQFIQIGTELLLPASVIGKIPMSAGDFEVALNQAKIERKISSNEVPLKVESDDHFEQSSFFTVSPTFSVVGVGSKDSVQYNGTDVSDSTKPSIGIKGEWRVLVQPQSSLSAYTTLDSLSFYGDPNYSLKNTHFMRTSFGISGEYKFNSLSAIETSAQINQNYFLEVVNQNNIQMRTLSQTEIQSVYKRNLFSIDRVHADWGLGAMVILPSSRGRFKTEMGYGYNLDLSTRFLSREIQLSYTQKYFKVNSINNQSQEVLARLNFAFGKEK